MSRMMRCESPEVFASGDFWVDSKRKERFNRAAFVSKHILYNRYIDSLLEGYYNKSQIQFDVNLFVCIMRNLGRDAQLLWEF